MANVKPLRELPAEELRAGVIPAGLPTPHGYVRGINLDYDRELLLATLTQAGAADDDLRVASGAGHDERWVFARRLPWDSQFFGRGIARIDAVVAPGREIGRREDTTPGIAALRRMLEHARERGIEYLTCTATAEQLPLQRTLIGAGFQLIETRLAHHGTLAGAPSERFPVRIATAGDVPSAAKAARESVNPFDRFHADVHFPEADADRLMEQWVRASVIDGFADLVYVPDEPEPEAFVTVKFHREHWEGWGMAVGQPIVAAVLPRHRGWYYKLIAESLHGLREAGADHVMLVTQITNAAVLRAWKRFGFDHGRGEHVFSIALG